MSHDFVLCEFCIAGAYVFNPVEEPYVFNPVEEMRVLEVMFDRIGSTRTTLEHCLAAATGSLYACRSFFKARRLSETSKTELFYSRPAGSLLFGTCGLHLSGDSLPQVKRWENAKLRSIWRTRRRPGELRKGHEEDQQVDYRQAAVPGQGSDACAHPPRSASVGCEGLAAALAIGGAFPLGEAIRVQERP